MKKLFLLLLIAAALLVSCSGKSQEDTAPADTDGTSAPAVTDVVTDEPTAPAVPQIELVTKTENIGSLQGSTKTFIYPKVTLNGSADLADRINRELEVACTNLYKRSLPGATSMVNGGAEIVYKTTECNTYLHNDRYLYVEFFVTIDVFTGGSDEMPSRAYSAVLIDIATGELCYPERLIKDLDRLKNALESGVFTVSDGVELTKNDISEALVQYRTDYGIYPSVYFDGERASVCVELAKLQGGYALFYISADKATEYFTNDFIG